MNWPGEVAFHSTAWTIVREVSASRAQVTVPVCSASGHNFGHSARAIHSNKVSLGRFVASFVAKGPRCSASPLPLWESIGRLRRPFLEKDAEAKLRLRRIDRCDPGEGLRTIDRPATSMVRSDPQLSRADFSEELGHLLAQLLALGFQRLGGALDIVGGRSGCVRIGFDAGDVVRDVLGALRGELGAAGNLLRRRTLLLDRGRDRGSD